MIYTDVSRFLRSLDINKRRLNFALESYAKSAGAKMVKYAKQNHPWENRSRAAQDSIGYKTEWETTTRLRLGLTSGVHYGVYLEFINFAHKGRLSIWWPTINKHSNEIYQGWAKAVNN